MHILPASELTLAKSHLATVLSKQEVAQENSDENSGVLQSPGGLWLCLGTSVGLRAPGLSGQGRVAPAVQAGGAAAGGDVAAVTAAGG